MSNGALAPYRRLQLYAARHRGIVPADEAILRRIGRCNPRDWKRCREEVLAAMEPCEAGYLIEDAKISEDQYERVCEKARAGGLAKAEKESLRWIPALDTISCAKPLKSLSGTLPVAVPDACQIAKSKEIRSLRLRIL
jgi:hypothetical protein